MCFIAQHITYLGEHCMCLPRSCVFRHIRTKCLAVSSSFFKILQILYMCVCVCVCTYVYVCIDAILHIIPFVCYVCCKYINRNFNFNFLSKTHKIFRGGTSGSSLRNYFLHVHQKYIHIYFFHCKFSNFITKFK